MGNIYWKLQSVNQTDELEIDSKEYELYREHYKKDYDTRELMTVQETVEHYRLHAWKNPLFSRIFSLTVAIVEDNIVKIIYYTGAEKDLIQTFLNTLKKERFKDYLVTHFGAEYILPYLGTRMDKNGIRTTIPAGLQYKNMKSWNLVGCCVRNYYSGAGNYKNSLKELAWIYGLETSFIEPVDEFTYYRTGQLKELRDSAVDEIYTLVNVHRLMVGENTVEDFTCNELFVESVEEVKQPILTKLFESKNFNQEVKEYLVSLNLKTEEDKINTIKIILANYQTKKDKVAVKKEKEKEVTDFINSL